MMSESLFSSIPVYAWNKHAASVSNRDEVGIRDSDDTGVHFHDFLAEVNPRQAQETIQLAQAVTDGGEVGGGLAAAGRVAALTPGEGRRQIGDAGLGAEQIEQLYATTRSVPVGREEAWTFVAPTVHVQRERLAVDGNPAYRIYAKSQDPGVHGIKEPVLSQDQGAGMDKRP